MTNHSLALPHMNHNTAVRFIPNDYTFGYRMYKTGKRFWDCANEEQRRGWNAGFEEGRQANCLVMSKEGAA